MDKSEEINTLCIQNRRSLRARLTRAKQSPTMSLPRKGGGTCSTLPFPHQEGGTFSTFPLPLREGMKGRGIKSVEFGKKKFMGVKFIVLGAAFFMWAAVGQAETVRNITAEGSCAIVGMSAEQSQLIALQRARAAAIEQAAGVSVVSGTLVTNLTLRADIIRTYSKGLIVSEKVEWLPLGQYQKDPSTPPIPEYRVRLVTDVYVPKPKIKPIGLQAKATGVVFKNGERATIEVKAGRDIRIGIFNITADDKVVLLFPNEFEKNNFLPKDKVLIFPEKNSRVELVMHTLPAHKRDAEAFYVIALDSGLGKDFPDLFTPGKPMNFTAFFKNYSEVADYCEDLILPYEVVDAKE